MSSVYEVTYTTQVEADDELDAIERADEKGGGHWEARRLDAPSTEARERITLCSYLLDGHDADGTAWYWCQVHDELAIGDETACAKAASMEGRSHVCRG